MNINQSLNPVIGLTGLLALALSAGIALAEVKETMTIKVVTGDGLSETVTVENLPVGASEVFLTEEGREVLITREDEVLTLEVDGRVIDVQLPSVDSVHDMGTAHKRVMFISDQGDLHTLDGDGVWVDQDKHIIVDADVDADVMVHGSSEERIVIRKQVRSSDDMTEAELQSLLEEMDIQVDLDGADGEREVIVIKKHVELHEEVDQDQ